MNCSAVLALADGTVFHGIAIGTHGVAVGEVVFNTAMTGYQEILTDPSYTAQLVALCHPHIGNTGTNDDDEESGSVWASGLIIKAATLIESNWRKQLPFTDYLRYHRVVAIANVDTRRLTRHIREHGAMGGVIMAGFALDTAVAIEQAKQFAGLEHQDLTQRVSTQRSYQWSAGSWQPPSGTQHSVTYSRTTAPLFHVVVLDFGVKRNSLRLLVDYGCRLTVVPASSTASEVLALKPDGVSLSNGPGDPAACSYAVETIPQLLAQRVPMFGICLGHQLLALASGARTFKMKYGHHGANHPVLDLATRKVAITSQNHGFAVSDDGLPADVEVTHRSLFDHTIQGIRLTRYPAFGFQGHPEARPGPNDLLNLFVEFNELMQRENQHTLEVTPNA